ncbi:hypothetical protein MO973_21020 [Paenibacillus sp. TRM 82003]|nr:hypothetical protein [Paenibacillus sp. TRM 82003]
MKLSDILPTSGKLISDGSFERMAQCTVRTVDKIFTFLDNPKYVSEVNSNPNISCLICRSEHLDEILNHSIGIICVEEPKLSFFKIHNELITNHSILSKVQSKVGNHCFISPSASISPYNVVIGDNVIIEDHVVIKENVSIGDGCIIRTGSVIGGQGYEYKREAQRSILRVVHAGKIIICNDVEIKEYCTIHQAVFEWDVTLIGAHSKLDAHSHIGHGTKVGNRVMIGSHGNLSGNITIGDDVNIGPGVTISNRLRIASRSNITLGSVVTKDVGSGKTVTGNFAIEHDDFIKDLKAKLSAKNDIDTAGDNDEK